MIHLTNRVSCSSDFFKAIPYNKGAENFSKNVRFTTYCHTVFNVCLFVYTLLIVHSATVVDIKNHNFILLSLVIKQVHVTEKLCEKKTNFSNPNNKSKAKSTRHVYAHYFPLSFGFSLGFPVHFVSIVVHSSKCILCVI